MNTKHTLGPWHIGMHPGPIIYGADSSQVADCRGDLLGKDESLANLRLIAAAPDLLAECERLRTINSELVAALEAAETSLSYAADLLQAPRVSAMRENLSDARAALARAKEPQS